MDIREYDYEEYLAMFGVVFQDFKLFAMTVAENVAASEEYDEQKIEEVLEKAGIWERVRKMEQGNHEELIARDGIYAMMWNAQAQNYQ